MVDLNLEQGIHWWIFETCCCFSADFEGPAMVKILFLACLRQVSRLKTVLSTVCLDTRAASKRDRRNEVASLSFGSSGSSLWSWHNRNSSNLFAQQGPKYFPVACSKRKHRRETASSLAPSTVGVTFSHAFVRCEFFLDINWNVLLLFRERTLPSRERPEWTVRKIDSIAEVDMSSPWRSVAVETSAILPMSCRATFTSPRASCRAPSSASLFPPCSSDRLFLFRS